MANFSLSFAILILLVASALGAPAALHAIETFSGETTGKHIVTLKQGVNKGDLLQTIKTKVPVTHDWDIINGFAVDCDDATLEALRTSPDVESIAEDGLMYAMATQ
jgi:cerevisin